MNAGFRVVPGGGCRLGFAGRKGVTHRLETESHFALVKSSANAMFFVDGAVQATRGSGMPNPAASTGLRFGWQYAANGEYWPGSLGDVRVWSKALSAAEISASFTNQLTLLAAAIDTSDAALGVLPKMDLEDSLGPH